MNDKIYTAEQIKTLLRPVFSRYGVIRAALYGSYARGEAVGASDVDILFEFGRSMPLSEWAVFEAELENVLGKDVDIAEFSSFSPRVAKEVLSELVLIYEKE